MLFGALPKGILGAGKPGRSEGGYIGDWRATIEFALSALGPVGMFAGKLLGDVFMVNALTLPLPPRGPPTGGIAPGEESRGT